MIRAELLTFVFSRCFYFFGPNFRFREWVIYGESELLGGPKSPCFVFVVSFSFLRHVRTGHETIEIPIAAHQNSDFYNFCLRPNADLRFQYVALLSHTVRDGGMVLGFVAFRALFRALDYPSVASGRFQTGLVLGSTRVCGPHFAKRRPRPTQLCLAWSPSYRTFYEVSLINERQSLPLRLHL